MIFRLGGFGLVCVVALFLLRDAHPYSALAVFLAYTTCCSYFRRQVPPNCAEQPTFGKWVVGRSERRMLWLFLLLWFWLFLVARETESDIVFSGGCTIFGGFLLWGAISAIRFGYFPDTHRGRGISRQGDALQFWALVGVYGAFGTLIMRAGLAAIP